MSETYLSRSAECAVRSEDRHGARLGATDWLGLAAAPTFALLALADLFGGGPPAICSAGASPLSGMVTMYLLMSVFHLRPWLKWMSRR
jgi:hypothetical protein